MRGRFERWLATYEADSIPELIVSVYQVPAVLMLMGFMLWTRLRAHENFVEEGEVFYSGNDAYYHFRQVSYTVENWPSTMPYDPWTQFPYGTSADQFGTLFDQLIATAALVIGLGDPSPQTIAMTVLVAPAIFGALVAIPVYFLGKRLGGTEGGVFAVFLLALLPGAFFQRSTVGFTDHHVAEVLFQSTAILATMVALTVAERDKPVYEQFLDQDWQGLREPLKWSALAGFAVGLYLWTWPPAIVLVGILGFFYLLALSYETARGRSPEHLAIVGIVSLAVTFVMTAINLDTTAGFQVTSLSPLQLALIAAVMAGCAFMAGFARFWETRDLDSRYYPVAIGALVIFGTVLTSIVLPDLFGSIVQNALRTFGFGQTDTTLTIAEAKAVPFNQLGSFMFQSYGLLFFTAAVGLIWLGLHVSREDRYRAELLLVIVWTVFTTLMALTQVRFNYYLAVVVAVLNVWLFKRVMPILDLPKTPEAVTEIKNYQIIAIFIIFLVMVVPLIPPVAAAGVVTSGQNVGPGSVVIWDDSLDWMASNTPEEGTYGGADNQMEYYGTYEHTGDFEYPAGAYGVMSWWDYGHWITVEGERIPIANPFQANAREASAFLLSDSEEHANLILEVLPSNPSDPPVYEMSTEELRATANDQSPQQAGEDTQYVIIDDQMAAGKFSAIATWTGPGPQLYFSQQEFQVGGTEAQLIGPDDDYHDTMLARLYLQDANGLSHYRLVHESGETAIVSVAQQTPQGLQSTNVINRRLSQSVFQAVQQRQDLFFYDVKQPGGSVKTFERVPGATLTGQVNTTNVTTVTAGVRLQTNAGRNFSYTQTVETDENGNFEITVPYATDDSVSVADGGTDSAVEALGKYEIVAGNPFQPTATGNTSVPETAIYEGETITVEMEEVERPSGNETSGNESTGNETSGGNESALVFPTGGGPSASLDAPGGLTGPNLRQPVAAPRRTADA